MDKVQELGKFEIKSGNVVISDPCYNLGTWCQGTVDKVKKGLWNATVIKVDEGPILGKRCAELIVAHESVNPNDLSDWELCKFQVGVDSGQAGIFDSEVYKNDDSVIKKEKTFMPDDLWYSSCCDITLSELGAGIINGGAVSTSGFGDGVYIAETSADENEEIISIRIIFIGEDDEEDDSSISNELSEECSCDTENKNTFDCETNECELHPKMCCLKCPDLISCTAPCEDGDYKSEKCNML